MYYFEQCAEMPYLFGVTWSIGSATGCSASRYQVPGVSYYFGQQHNRPNLIRKNNEYIQVFVRTLGPVYYGAPLV